MVLLGTATFLVSSVTTFIEEVGCDWCDPNFRNVWSHDNLSVASRGRSSHFLNDYPLNTSC